MVAQGHDLPDIDAGPLARKIGEWAGEILEPYLQRYPSNPHRESKIIHDPIGKAIRLERWEIYILDSPLLQRLRAIRQLGVGHFLFPTSGYSRFEHSVGCVQAATTLFDSVSEQDDNRSVLYEAGQLFARRDIVRLAALLHDVGHSIMSHVSEKFYAQDREVVAAQKLLKRHYQNSVAPAEAVAIFILRSEAFRRLLDASAMRRTVYREREIIDKVCACIAGSKHAMLPDAYLAELVNGPVDCDKLDYLARDAHMAGVPISLDIDRLCSKLRIARKIGSDGNPIHHLAIVPSGARALEEMLVSRIFLYDKFYYHPKIMAAEELIRRALFYLTRACPDFRSPRTLLEYGDDEFLSLTPKYISGRYNIEENDEDLMRGCELLGRARSRDLPKRAFAFARRFIPEMPEAYSRFVNRGKGDTVPQAVQEYIDTDRLLRSTDGIDVHVQAIGTLLHNLSAETEVFIGYQSPERVAGKMDMPVLMPNGEADATPDFMFNVSKWGDAYKLQKQTSYVFAYDHLPQVHLAAECHFAQRGMTFAPKCWVFSKLAEDDIAAARSALPENDHWLPYRLAPNFLDSKDAQSRLAQLKERFSPYLRGVHSTLGPALVESWVWQFGDADLRDSAITFLEHIKVVEKADIVAGFERTVDNKPHLRSALWIPLRHRNGIGESADLIRYNLKDFKLEMRDVGVVSASDIRNAGCVVLFDDLLNSGTQAECLLTSWFVGPDGPCESPDDRDAAGRLAPDIIQALKDVPVEFAYYSKHPMGEERLQRTCKEVGLNLGDVSSRINTGDDRYTLKGFRTESSASRDRFIQHMQQVGERLLTEKYGDRPDWTVDRIHRYALGFGGLRMMLLYVHSVSTAMPVGLWQMSTDIMNPWLPLFPRKDSELRRLLDPSGMTEEHDDDLPEYLGGEALEI